MGTTRLERRINDQRIENSKADEETMLLTTSATDEVNVVSDDESDFVCSSTSRLCRTTTHDPAHHDDAVPSEPVCDSCQYCNDVCEVPNCTDCQSKTSNYLRKGITQQRHRVFTMCQIRRHNSIENSVWIVADDTVYDVTSYIQYHPGGMECILKKAGGKHNCMRDLQFHSHRGQQLFNKYAIGKVVSCPGCVTTAVATATNSAANTSRPSMIATLEAHRWFLW